MAYALKPGVLRLAALTATMMMASQAVPAGALRSAHETAADGRAVGAQSQPVGTASSAVRADALAEQSGALTRHTVALAQAVAAVDAPADAAGTEAAKSQAGPFAAAEIDFEAQRYAARPLVVFANSPEDPEFRRQLAALMLGLDDLAFRDVVVVLDTDPAAMSEWRRHIRPRGFSLVQLDKDFSLVFRKPLPWSVREIMRSIDKLDSRRQELAERFPGR